METPVSEGLVSKRSLRKKSVQKNYDENAMDEFIEKRIGSSFRKIRMKEELEKETETEAMIALSLGFPIDALIEEEIRAGVVKELGGKEQNDYIVVRNHILSRWRSNVRIWLTRGQIKETVSNEYVHLLSAAYDFLLNNGYINFGVSPSFSAYHPEEATEGSVIIVGAGLAGLAAGRQLLSFGFKVVVIEGRNRPGGWVYTHQRPDLSGLREASRILRATRGRQNYKRCAQQNVGPSGDLMVDLFKRPDLVFGNFSFVFNPLAEDPKSLGLLRITFEICKDDMRKVLKKPPPPIKSAIATVHISREQSHELQTATGEEENKLVY